MLQPEQIIFKQDFPKLNGLRKFSLVLWFDSQKPVGMAGRFVVHRMYADDGTLDTGSYCVDYQEALDTYRERCNDTMRLFTHRWEEINRERIDASH